MEAKAHKEKWSSIPSYMSSFLRDFSATIQDKDGTEKSVTICYKPEGSTEPLYFL